MGKPPVACPVGDCAISAQAFCSIPPVSILAGGVFGPLPNLPHLRHIFDHNQWASSIPSTMPPCISLSLDPGPDCLKMPCRRPLVDVSVYFYQVDGHPSLTG